VIGLWDAGENRSDERESEARSELLYEAALLKAWYEQLGAGLVGEQSIPDAMPESLASNRRLIDALTDDLNAVGGRSANAVLLIWTRDYLETARKFQATLVSPARGAAARPTVARST